MKTVKNGSIVTVNGEGDTLFKVLEIAGKYATVLNVKAGYGWSVSLHNMTVVSKSEVKERIAKLEYELSQLKSSVE